jgi:hypothetical protein
MQVHDATQSCDWVPEGGREPWQCATCTLQNDGSRTACEVCGTPKR